MATVIIPTPLRKFANNSARIDVTAFSISDIVNQLAVSYPELKKHLVDTSGRIAPFINIFVDNQDIRNLNCEQTEVLEDAVVCIIPAIAGGSKR
jgi:molybdopterin synthase sulfur carrier subunit